MTEKLYLNEAYMKECEARIIKIAGNDLILDRTVFYAAGGGQPGDTGIIRCGERNYEVLDTVKDGNDVVHKMKNTDGLSEGDFCHCTINWERRYRIMKFHSAIHLMDGLINNMPIKNGLITGSQIYEDRARVDFSIEEFTKENVNNIISTVNDAIKEGHNIHVKYLPSEEALKVPNLARTEPGRELLRHLAVVRIIEIQDIDAQADGGTHVKNTSEIGTIKLLKIENKGRNNKRLYFQTEP